MSNDQPVQPPEGWVQTEIGLLPVDDPALYPAHDDLSLTHDFEEAERNGDGMPPGVGFAVDLVGLADQFPDGTRVRVVKETGSADLGSEWVIERINGRDARFPICAINDRGVRTIFAPHEIEAPTQLTPGSLRVWWIPQVPGDGEAFHVPVGSVSEGLRLMDVLADYDQFQFDHKIKPDYANAGGIERFEDGEWCDFLVYGWQWLPHGRQNTPPGMDVRLWVPK